jgi:hypothetical protein
MALCDTGGSAWGYIVPILALAAWGAFVFAILRRSADEDRLWLLGLLIGCMTIGALLFLGSEVLNGGHDYLGVFFVSLGVSAVLGLATGLMRERATLLSVAAAIAGDVFLPGISLLFVIWLFVGTGFCLS